MRNARVIYHHEAEGWWAESPEVPGWNAAGATLAEVRELAEEGVQFFAEETLHLMHEIPQSDYPTIMTAGSPAKLVVIEAVPRVQSPHFEEQSVRTANELEPA